MPPKSRLNWTYGGRRIDPREIKADILESYEDVGEKAVEELVKEVENLVDRLKRRSKESNPYSTGNSFADSEVMSEEFEPGKWRIWVTGNVFNWLDSGRAAFHAKNGKALVFPSYDGSLTKEGENSATLNASGRTLPSSTYPEWIVVEAVDRIKPRNFLEDLVARRSKNLNFLKYGTYKTGKGYKWRFDPREVYVRVRENTTSGSNN